MSDLSRFQHPRFARMYERISADSERRGTAGYRDQALAGLSGRVIEVGAGNGMNFAHYPQAVTDDCGGRRITKVFFVLPRQDEEERCDGHDDRRDERVVRSWRWAACRLR